MALFLVASTISWTVEQHYCMGRLMDTAIFASAVPCGGMQISDVATSLKQKMPCCDDEITIIKGQEDLKISFDTITILQQAFLLSYADTYLNLFDGLEEHIVPFNQYPPPILVADIQLLDQVFLI